MTELLERITEAEAAAVKVAELETVKAQADALPALKRQLAAQRWIEQAEPAADEAEGKRRGTSLAGKPCAAPTRLMC